MKPALLLVDLQNDHLATPELRPSADTVVTRAAVLLDHCRHQRIPVIHVWTTIRRDEDRRLPHWKRTDRWLCVAGTSGHQPPARLQPRAGETIIHKTGFNAFAGATLDAALRQMNCDAVILAGVHLHACIRTAAAESLERGLEVFIAEDAVGSNDPVHAAAVRRWLTERCVQFEPVNAVLSRLDGNEPSRTKMVHRSPREMEKIAFEVPMAGADEIAAAAAAAKSAWTKWRQRPPSSCQPLLGKVAERLEAAAPDLARQMAVEIGKPLSHGLEEVHRAAGNIRDVVHRAANFER
jgi:nicotinamidase-related amidase